MEQAQFLVKLKQGDESAFVFLYNSYWRKVYRFAEIYLSDEEEIKEIVQQVFIKLWESRASIDEHREIDGLLFILSRNLIFDTFRKSQNRTMLKLTAVEVA